MPIGPAPRPATGQTATIPRRPTANATRLGRAIEALVAAHPGLSGIHGLPDGHDAFAARVHLAQSAERSLDVQYYIWHLDMTGVLLFEALRAAADRGVQVRLLLDDNTTTTGLDATLAALDTHPNIQVRLFNPFKQRRARWFGFLSDFSRLNRRMHNKSFTADAQATIVGGRNVGDEYFGAAEEVLFVDLDVIAVGPAVQAVCADFERYWSCDSVYPVERVLAAGRPAQLDQLAASAARLMHDPAALAYAAALCESPFVSELDESRLTLHWATTRLVSDDPAKGLGRAAPEAMLPHKLRAIIGNATRSLVLISPYFVPTRTGVAALTALAAQGLRIQILTNSLEATDVAVVHAGYVGRRKPLLEAGIKLYELQRLSTHRRRRTGKGRFGRSASSLHAKTFAVDGDRVFVGSFNFDPRSARLNTEMGLVIECAALARKVEAAFADDATAYAYEVRLRDSGRLYWVEQRAAGPVQHGIEPGTSLWGRAAVWWLALLPIEWML